MPSPKTWIDWDEKIAAATRLAAACRLCPRACGINRLAGETGFCRATDAMRVSSLFAHHGEEPPLSGTNGSGTIFFTYCTLQCLFCQNHQLSHEGEGRLYTPHELADGMMALQAQGCHNINLVTADHYLPWVLQSQKLATAEGLSIPIVYNCSGYTSIEAVAILRDVVDIFLPDMKFSRSDPAKILSQAPDYPSANRAAIQSMFNQVGPLRQDRDGHALRGLILRHLVLPEERAGSFETLDWLIATFDPEDITMSVMAQYHPVFRAAEYPPINRPLTKAEYEPVKEAFIAAGFNGFFQELERIDNGFLIDFKARKSEPLLGTGA